MKFPVPHWHVACNKRGDSLIRRQPDSKTVGKTDNYRRKAVKGNDMSTELGIRINPSGSGRHGQEPQGGSRRQQHQQKLKALIDALDSGDLIEAKVNYRLLLEFSPALAHSNFARVGEALAAANLAMARRVIEEIYGQSQAIFKRAVAAPSMMPSSSSRLGVLVDSSA